MPKLSGEDINVNGCTYVAEGNTPADVLRGMVEHLETEHGMDLPDVDAILSGTVDEKRLDHGTKLVLKRLRERLELPDKGSAEQEMPPTVTPPGRGS